MNLTVQELDHGIRQLNLEGRLDIAGSGAIETKFQSYAAGTVEKVLVDLSKVDFIASIGIRTLLSAAKARRAKGGTLVLCGASPLVAKVLETAGITTIVPVVADAAAGVALLQGS
jgi:anti-anti-sigma factor